MNVYICFFLSILLIGGYSIIHIMQKYYLANDNKIKFIKDELDELKKKIEKKEVVVVEEKNNSL